MSFPFRNWLRHLPEGKFWSFRAGEPAPARSCLLQARLAPVAALLWGASLMAGTADWPHWRHDARRSGATDEPGPSQGTRLWEWVGPKPDPAYPHQFRMCADATYAPVAAGGRLFLPSNVSDSVTAIDLESGAVLWRHFAEGPVRMAPVCVRDRVLFASDDGYLHAVSAADGARLWKVRGAPEDRPRHRMLINGRMVSRWPARGAPVAQDGVAYFGAGVWPEEGVYVCAVNVETGKLLWRSDAMSYVRQGMSDHGQAYDLSLPPHGYLAFLDGRLAVPSGRTLAAWFDPVAGTMEPYTSFYVKHNPPRGTWFLAGWDRFVVQGGNWFGARPDAAPELPDELKDARSALFWSREPMANELYAIRNRPFLNTDTVLLHDENRYVEPVLADGVCYQSEHVEERSYLVPRGHTFVDFRGFDRIVARDMTRPRWTSTEHMHLGAGRRRVSMPRLDFPLLWEMASPLRVLIKAGDRLFAGGANSVASVAIPGPGGAPRIEWEAGVDGAPVHALVADGKLVVVTDTGRVTCFGEGVAPVPSGPPAAKMADERNGPETGYSLLVGWGDGSILGSLAAGTGRRVIVTESDAARAEAARQALAEEGLLGWPVQVLSGELGAMGFAPYWADRVLFGADAAADLPEAALAEAIEVLRPHTGELRASGAAALKTRLSRLLTGHPGYALSTDGGELVVRRLSPPPGAANWTHEAGDAANRFASSDDLVKWPLGVLWYSGDIDRFFTPEAHFQHERHPYPLVRDGRMFLITGERIHAVDIYTGRYLWRAEMPLTPYVKTRFFDSRKYGRPTERNAVVAPDRFYAVTGARIHAFDTATGEPRGVIEIPASLRDEAHGEINEPRKVKAHGHEDVVQPAPEWIEVRLWDDVLLAMLGRNLAAVDRHSGALRWFRPSKRETTTYAVAGDLAIGYDFDPPPLFGARKEGIKGRLFALDPRDGSVRWELEAELPPPPKFERDPTRPWIEAVHPIVAINAKHGLAFLVANRNDIRAFRLADGSPAWNGPPVTQPDPLGVYSPVITDDHLLLSQYRGAFGHLFEVATGQEVGPDTAIPRPRTCARAIGNNHLLVYRNAATDLYDIAGNRMIGLNSLRSGCTTSFIPAGGVMAAPMLAHGCVCNYPMFASLALHHMPGMDRHRPQAVLDSWRNRWTDNQLAVAAASAGPSVDVSNFRTRDATVESAPGGALFRTVGDKAGYAIRAADKAMASATFALTFRRAPSLDGAKRHGNAFLIFGFGPEPADWVECQVYYGGRSSLAFSGHRVEPVSRKVDFERSGDFDLEVTVDGESGTVTMEANGQKISTRLKSSVGPVTHYGYGGANSDTLFGEIRLPHSRTK